MRPRLIRTAFVDSGIHRRTLVNTSQRPASVLDQKVASTSKLSSSSNTEEATPLKSTIYGSKELLEAKREKKFAQYERILAEKAKR